MIKQGPGCKIQEISFKIHTDYGNRQTHAHTFFQFASAHSARTTVSDIFLNVFPNPTTQRIAT